MKKYRVVTVVMLALGVGLAAGCERSAAPDDGDQQTAEAESPKSETGDTSTTEGAAEAPEPNEEPSCVEKCVQSRQMEARPIQAIRADCRERCEKQ